MSLLDPMEIFKKRGKLDTFTQIDIEPLMPVISLFLFSIENDMKEGNINKRLTLEKDLLFNLPPLYTLLLTDHAEEAIKLFKEWFLSKTNTISCENMNIYLRKFFDYISDSAMINFRNLVQSNSSTLDFFDLYISFINSLVKSDPFKFEDETNEMILRSPLDILNIIREVEGLPEKIKSQYCVRLLDTFCDNFLCGHLSDVTMSSLITIFAEVSQMNLQWKYLLCKVFSSLMKFQDNKYLLNMFFLLKNTMNPIQHSAVFANAFIAALGEINSLIEDDTIFLNSYNGTNVLKLVGDWAFLMNFPNIEIMDGHLCTLMNLFTRANVSDVWIDAFAKYVFFLSSKNAPEFSLCLINNSAELISLKPSVAEKIFYSIIMSICSIHFEQKVQMMFLQSGGWINFIGCLNTLISSQHLYNWGNSFSNMITKLLDTPQALFRVDSLAFHRFTLMLQLNNETIFFKQFMCLANFIQSNPAIDKPRDVNFIILCLVLSTYFLTNFEPLAEIFDRLTKWISTSLKSDNEITIIVILFALIECGRKIKINSQIISSLVHLKTITNPHIKLLVSLAIHVLTIPQIKPPSKAIENLYSYYIQDKIMSFAKSDALHIQMYVRSQFGISSFIVSTPKKDVFVPSEDKMKPNAPRLHDLEYNNTGPFPSAILPQAEDTKSDALRILNNFGLTDCQNPAKHLAIADFSSFDVLCAPPRFTIHVSCVTKKATSINLEPTETNNFSLFLSDLGDHYDMFLSGFYFQKHSIGSDVSILFSDCRLSIKEIKCDIPLLVIVSPLLEKGERLYIISIRGKAPLSTLSVLPFGEKRLFRCSQLPIIISSICFFYYSQMKVEKNGKTVVDCPICDNLGKLIQQRKDFIDNMSNNV